MTTSIVNQNLRAKQHVDDINVRGVYRLGAIGALLMIVMAVLDIAVSLIVPEETTPGALDTVAWFELFAHDSFRAFRDLGILNVVNILLGIPMMYALYHTQRQNQQAIANLALIVFLIGGGIYIANNTVLPLYALSQDYGAATSELQRTSLISAGEAMLARGADFTPGSLVGLCLPNIAGLLMAYAVLNSGVLHKVTAYIGFVGYGAVLIFTVWVTINPDALLNAMLVAMIGGIATIFWNLLVARRLFQLASQG